MKKIYAVLVVCFTLTLSVSAQTYFWIGPSGGAGGNWNDNANWSLSSGGPAVGAGVFPNNAVHNVIFDQNALVNVNIENIDLLSITVTNSRTAKLFVGGAMTGPTINLFSTLLASPALKINTGSRLEDSCDTNIPFTIAFNNNAKGLVDGTWYFAGRNTVIGSNGATFTVPGITALTNRVDVNGTIQFRNNTVCPNPITGQDYLFFNSGSTFWLDRNQGNSPRATWDANSTILITGVTTLCPSINVGTVKEIGNLVFNCPGVSVANIGWSIGFPLTVKGNFQVLNTNNRTVILASNGSAFVNIFDYTVNGNFEVSGTNTRVAIANASNSSKVVNFQVNGDLNIGGSSFDLQISNNVVANPTTLKVKGNINHTAGTFGSSSNSVNTTTDLFVVELNGTSNQNISSTGTINNANDELTLLLNNPAGATLTTPITVGKLSFNSAGKGKLTTTTANVLTINNTGVHSLVVNSPSPTGFVNGPVRRRTASTSDYTMPTGKGSIYDPVIMRPSAATTSIYQAEYFGVAFSDLTTISPINGVTNQEYWQVSTASGTDAAIIITLRAAVPGAIATDGIVVARYNGADWVDFSSGGTIIQPGNSTVGAARSTIATINGFYTFGYGIAGALPIRLLNFDARKISSGSAQVSWLISTNSNAEQFEVLKSADGRNFTAAGLVLAIDRQVNYSFTDNNLFTGTSYYRLKMVDKDGKISYSQIVAVMNGAKGILLTSMIPTIVSSSATLTISSSEKGTMQLMVTDMYGRIVKQQLVSIGTGNQQVVLNLQSLASGAYQVTAVMNNSQVGTIRFLRQ